METEKANDSHGTDGKGMDDAAQVLPETELDTAAQNDDEDPTEPNPATDSPESDTDGAGDKLGTNSHAGTLPPLPETEAATDEADDGAADPVQDSQPVKPLGGATHQYNHVACGGVAFYLSRPLVSGERLGAIVTCMHCGARLKQVFPRHVTEVK